MLPDHTLETQSKYCETIPDSKNVSRQQGELLSQNWPELQSRLDHRQRSPTHTLTSGDWLLRSMTSMNKPNSKDL